MDGWLDASPATCPTTCVSANLIQCIVESVKKEVDIGAQESSGGQQMPTREHTQSKRQVVITLS